MGTHHDGMLMILAVSRRRAIVSDTRGATTVTMELLDVVPNMFQLQKYHECNRCQKEHEKENLAILSVVPPGSRPWFDVLDGQVDRVVESLIMIQ